MTVARSSQAFVDHPCDGMRRYGGVVDLFAAVDRPHQPRDADEVSTLLGMLDVQRATLARKCAGLDDAELKANAVGPSSLSLLGIVRHLAEVERFWIDVVFGGADDIALFGGTSTDDVDFEDLDGFAVEVVARAWLDAGARTNAVAEATPLEQLAVAPPAWMGGGAISLRFIVVHLLAEYARHCGHADLLREQVDGATGW